MATRYPGVLLDLFGTLITFDAARLPELVVDGQRVRTSVGALGPLLAEWVPGTSPAEFLTALTAVSGELIRARATDHVEHPSRERFRRALARIGYDGAMQLEAAAALSRAHMNVIVEATVLPPAHRALLDRLRRCHRLALVSNFDDTAAAYDILARHAILPALDTVVVSEAVGLRKPHPALARSALRGLGLAPGEVVFVGDTFAEDVAGAQAAGVDVVWIDTRGQGAPPGSAAPTYVVRSLVELEPILDGLGG